MSGWYFPSKQGCEGRKGDDRATEAMGALLGIRRAALCTQPYTLQSFCFLGTVFVWKQHPLI